MRTEQSNSQGEFICEKPIQFIYFEESRPQLNKEAKKILLNLDKSIPIKVICIIGAYRTGKSFILNQLLEKPKSFQVGHQSDGKTRGIWIWGEKETSNEQNSHYLLTLDTEGLFENGDEKDVKLFILSLLLGSFVIYNCLNTLDTQQVENLALISTLTQHIKSSSDGANEQQHSISELSDLFPPLLWLIRNFQSGYGQGIKNDQEYLSSFLNNRPQKSKENAELIKNCFREKSTGRSTLTCKTLPFPINDTEKIQMMEDLSKSEFRKSFLDGIAELLASIRKSPFKSYGRVNWNGHTFAEFAEKYVETLSKPNSSIVVPSIASVVFREHAKKMYLESMKAKRKEWEFPVKKLIIIEEHQKLLGKIKQQRTIAESEWISFKEEMEMELKRLTDENKQEIMKEFKIELEKNNTMENLDNLSKKYGEMDDSLEEKFSKERSLLQYKIIEDLTRKVDNMSIKLSKISSAENNRNNVEFAASRCSNLDSFDDRSSRSSSRVAVNTDFIGDDGNFDDRYSRSSSRLVAKKDYFDDEDDKDDRSSRSSLSSSSSKKSDGEVFVNGYTKKNGTVVDPYYRSSPSKSSSSSSFSPSYSSSPSSSSSSSSSGSRTYVSGYTKANGTVVSGYYRNK